MVKALRRLACLGRRLRVGGHPREKLEHRDRGLLERVDANTRWQAGRLRWKERHALTSGESPPPIPSFSGPVEDPPEGSRERLGICCSGGGIRSAAFNLGALQVLQQRHELRKATYLAAVSGGSYIAAAFAMVAKHWPAAGPRPQADANDPCNGHDDSDPELLEEKPPFAPGSPEEQYLRNRSSYMAPDFTGKFFLLYRLVLGLLFNVVLLAAPLFGATLLLGLVLGTEYPNLESGLKVTDTAVPDLILWICLGAVAVSLAIGIATLVVRMSNDAGNQALQVLAVWALIVTALLALATIGLPELAIWAHNRAVSHSENRLHLGVGSLAGLLTGVIAYVREILFTPKPEAKPESGTAAKAGRALGSKVRLALAYAAAGIAGPLLLIVVMAYAVTLALQADPGVSLPLLAAGLLVGSAIVYATADISSWSLHPYYKRRLCTAFALKRVRARDGEGLTDADREELEATPDGREWLERPIAVERDFNTHVPLSRTALDGEPSSSGGFPACPSKTAAKRWPTLIVCAAANVSDPGATPPGRAVTSFTFSAHSVGEPLVGAARTEDIENAFVGVGRAARTGLGTEHRRKRSLRRARDLTLAAAVAISGAAVAPSMGKITRPSLRFLLALANVRLGVWVPNPRWVASGKDSHTRRAAVDRFVHSRPRPSYLIKELIGRNRIDDKYLFVTDGGHYENLGLVELLRRGCTQIYCFDASGGRPDAALGDAIALARSELGIEIEIDPSGLLPGGEYGYAHTNAVRGRFTYPEDRSGGRCRREGVLVYARCVMTDELPVDVKAHHAEDPAFPHNSTADQLYTDQKFESYRKLGECAGGTAVGLMGTVPV